MRNNILIFMMLFGSLVLQAQDDKYPPEGFVYLQKAIPEIQLEVRYHGSNNFLGKPVNGYTQPVIVISEAAASSLKKVAAELKTLGHGLKVFDAYRPQRAVNHFVEWAQVPDDTLTKTSFYPEISKNQLFNLGYIASRSGHTRGSAIDLTLVDLQNGCEVDMGSTYDFFGEISHHGTDLIRQQQEQNRNILKESMLRHGFNLYPEEWWHFSLKNEPFPDTYFDFPIE